MSLRQHLRALGTRFDAQALRPPLAVAHAATLLQRHSALRDQLQAWCWQGAGPGNAAWWQPGAQPALGQRLAVAALWAPPAAADAGPAKSTHLADWANAFARQLDGSTGLGDLPSKLSVLQLRLAVKLQDAQWWRSRQPTDPWDAGWTINTAAALQQLQQHWLPRRATLVLADDRAADALRPCLAGLVQRSAAFLHPVRWVWVGGDDGHTAASQGLPVARFAVGGLAAS